MSEQTYSGKDGHHHLWSAWTSRYVEQGYEQRVCLCGAYQKRPIVQADAEPQSLRA